MKYFWLGVLFLTACSTQPTFSPEVGGPGAMFFRGGVVYSVPPKNPVVKMKLVSLGITKDNMLMVRMYFLRKGPAAGEYLDPKEQMVWLPDAASGILPAHVHANGVGKPLVKLAEAQRQAVELFFPVPRGGHDYPYVKLDWKIHYTKDGANKTVAETERFDLVQKEGTQEGVGSYSGDAEFPYGYANAQDMWFANDLMWW
jgi:hypothetical protein